MTAAVSSSRDRDESEGFMSAGPGTILFVCTANICRSPMAEAIFNVLAKERGLSHRAESAGVLDLSAAPMASGARDVLGEIGIPAGDHRSREVTEDMLRHARLVLVMGPRHAEELTRRFGESQKVRLLQEYASGIPDGRELPDPYGQNILTYRASARQIFECVEGVVGRLERELP